MNEDPNEKYAVMHSGSAPSFCPSDPRAVKGARRRDWQYKEFKEGRNEWREDGGIKVTRAQA